MSARAHLSRSKSLRRTLAEPMKSSVVRSRSYTCVATATVTMVTKETLFFFPQNIMLTHLDVEPLTEVPDGDGKVLAPHRIQVLEDHFALVDGLPLQFELHVRVAGA